MKIINLKKKDKSEYIYRIFKFVYSFIPFSYISVIFQNYASCNQLWLMKRRNFTSATANMSIEEKKKVN